GGPSNGLPAVSYGPWSPTFTTVNPPQTDGTLAPTETVADQDETVSTKAKGFNLTPGFAWQPSAPVVTDGIDPHSALYRVYIATDKNCVNRVFTGSVVGSPAWAPRVIGGPIALPADTKALATAVGGRYPGAGQEGTARDATGDDAVANEAQVAPGSTGGGAAPAGSSASSSAAASSSGATAGQRAPVELWDSGWPSGRYYWTVVPVTIFEKSPPDPTDPNPTIPIGYQDTAVPQDACQAGDL